jgi:glycosyltransferase involved in cell wall biosynthesis
MAKPKKFIQLVPFYPTPYELHHKEDYFLMPADIMAEKGMEVEFITLRNTAPTGEYKTGNNLAAPEEMVKGYKVKRFGNALSLYHYMRNQKNSLLQVHLRPYPPAQFAGFVAPQKKALRPFTYLLGSNKIIEQLTKWVMPKYDLIQCVTPYEIEIYKNAGVPEKKMKWIPLSIDYNFFSTPVQAESKAIAEKFGYADSEFVVISIAQIRKHKRFDDVMRALKIVKEKIPSAKFLAVGEDWLPRQNLPDIMATADSCGVRDSVIWTGFQDMQSVRALLQSSTAFVHGADNEYQGLVSYEAAAAGVPICLSNIGSHTSVFGESALYHEVTDHETLAKNLLKCYEEKELVRKNTAHLKNLMKDWDYDVIKKKMSDSYEGIMA